MIDDLIESCLLIQKLPPWHESCLRFFFIKGNFIGDAKQIDGHDSQLYKSIELTGNHDRQPGNNVLLVTPKLSCSHDRQLTGDARQFSIHHSQLKRTSG